MTTIPMNSFGRYEVKRSLGRGSQGRVYLANDPQLERDVAIKVLTSSKAEFNLRGSNGAPLEALIASRVKHPNIIPIHDIGDSELGPYLVFGYVDGRTLALELGYEPKRTLEDAIPMMATILDAMAAAHAAGVLHLDLGPRNIMIDCDGKPQIMDFGLSQFINFERTDLSLATGTLRYMAPEHFLRLQLGPFTDVFALASMFYEMLVGERAIYGANVEEMQRKIAAADIDFGKLQGLPHNQELLRFFKGAFAVDTKARYADAGVMRDAFNLMVTACGLTDSARPDSPSHSTVDFLVRRMQRKKDFPAISSTLTDINRLTGDDGDGNADKLANVILRDMALTSKLLKMANSSFYGARAVEVTSISQAVVLLGLQQIRMVASSLILFGNLKSDSEVLKDSMTKSFFAGLLARHLSKRERLRNAEEAFIAGMCQNLGENLTIYYFSEEHEEIEQERVSQQIDKLTAAKVVLGVTYADLGATVAEIWSLPQIIVDTIRGEPGEEITAPASEDEKIRAICLFTNRLCDLFLHTETGQITEAMDELAEVFSSTASLEAGYLHKLLAVGYEKLCQFAPVFEINVNSSAFCKAISSWLEHRQRELDALDAQSDAESARTATSA